MRKFFILLVFTLFLFVAQASADTFTINDTWVDWNNQTPEVGDEYYSGVTEDDYGSPEIKKMKVLLSKSGILKKVDILLDSEGWLDRNSLFINSYADNGAEGTGDWDYLVHSGGIWDSSLTLGDVDVPGNGIWEVGDSYAYTMTKGDNSVRKNSPNGIDSANLTFLENGTGWNPKWNRNKAELNYKRYSYNFADFDFDIDLSKGGFFAFSPYCANDLIGGEVNPVTVPEPATLALLGIGLLGLAGVVRRRTSK